MVIFPKHELHWFTFDFYSRPSMTKTLVIHRLPWKWLWERWHQVNGHQDKELAEEPEPEVFAEPFIEVPVIMIAYSPYWRGCQDPYSTIATLTSARLTTNYHGLPGLDSFLSQVTSRRGSEGEALVETNVSIFSHYFFHFDPILLDFLQACHIHNLYNFVWST